MSNSQIEIINAQTEDNLTGIVLDSVPHLYWLRVYQALGIRKEHAPKIIARLTEGIHYRKFTRAEFALLSGTVDITATVYVGAKSFVFLTAEGYNRAIMEITESRLNDPEVAAAINAKKDHIASIYTRYQAGETLSLATDQTPALQGELLESPNEDVGKIKIANLMNSLIRKAGTPRNLSNAITAEWIRDNVKTDVSAFLNVIPDSEIYDTPPDDANQTRKQVAETLKQPLDILDTKLIEFGWMTHSSMGWNITKKGSRYLKTDRIRGPKGRLRLDVLIGFDGIRILKAEFEQQIFSKRFLSTGQSTGYLPDLITKRNSRKNFGTPRGA